jgi:hypothetical protein
MKKLALAATLVLAAGCAQHGSPMLPSEPYGPQMEQAASAKAVIWTQTDGYKVRPDDKPIIKNKTVTISGAKGETTAFQIIVTAKAKALGGVDVALSDLTDGHGHTLSAVKDVALFREAYIDLTQPSGSTGKTGEFPDGLIPIGKDAYYHEQRNGAPFSVPAQENQGVWGEVAIPASAVAGIYHGTAKITAARATLGSVPITLTVWNFAIPATSSISIAFGLNSSDTYNGHYKTYNGTKLLKLLNVYQAEALKHRISVYEALVAPPQYTWAGNKIQGMDYTDYDSTMVPELNGNLAKNGAQGTTAEFPNANPQPPPGPTPGPNDAQYIAFFKAVRQHFISENWYDRAFYYDIDEPSTPQDFADAAYRADLLHKVDPKMKAMVTTHLRKDLIGKVDIWTVVVNWLDSPGYPTPADYAKRQKAGDKVWLYHGNDSLASGGPWPNFFVDRGMNDARIFGWMAYRYNMDGLLYYAMTNTYGRYPNPWTDVWNFGDNGDGVLFYPGRTSIIGGKHDIPCPSIRLKAMRAGLQDYEYMRILHTMGQDAFVDALVRKLVVKTNNWTQNPEAIEKAREEMAVRISGK